MYLVLTMHFWTITFKSRMLINETFLVNFKHYAYLFIFKFVFLSPTVLRKMQDRICSLLQHIFSLQLHSALICIYQKQMQGSYSRTIKKCIQFLLTTQQYIYSENIFELWTISVLVDEQRRETVSIGRPSSSNPRGS